MSATNNFYVTKLADKLTNHEISQITANKMPIIINQSVPLKAVNIQFLGADAIQQ